jgi:hypothetical protein
MRTPFEDAIREGDWTRAARLLHETSLTEWRDRDLTVLQAMALQFDASEAWYALAKQVLHDDSADQLPMRSSIWVHPNGLYFNEGGYLHRPHEESPLHILLRKHVQSPDHFTDEEVARALKLFVAIYPEDPYDRYSGPFGPRTTAFELAEGNRVLTDALLTKQERERKYARELLLALPSDVVENIAQFLGGKKKQRKGKHLK